MIRKLVYIIFGIIILTDIVSSLYSIYLGNVAFWFDPARDILLASSSLHKLTLIGTATGIPGLFYGPYWIWLISIPLILSKDPRFVVFTVQFLPYLILGTYICLKLSKQFGKWSLIPLLYLFLGFPQYLTQLWNPHLAPLFILITIFLVGKGNIPFLLGISVGLIVNFHFSFGIAVVLGLVIFLITQFILKTRFFKKNLNYLVAVFSGIATTFLPFVIFESRHGFNQTKSLFWTLSQSFLYNSAVVGQTGLNRKEIIDSLIFLPAQVLQLPNALGPTIIILSLGLFFVLLLTRRISVMSFEGRILFFSLGSLLTVPYIYFSTKNPVWPYHFIGIETFIIVLISLLAGKIKSLGIILTLSILIFSIYSTAKNDRIPKYDSPTLAAKEKIVKDIISDAKQEPFTYAAYSPSIYTYDYDYLFKWIADKKIIPNSNTIYLIIPETKKENFDDFINYKTNNNQYTTIKMTKYPDKTTVIKRQKIL